MNSERTFGDFILHQRKNSEEYLSARELANKLGVSAVYICDMEKGRKPAPSGEVLEKMCDILCRTKEERDTFYDLAGRSKHTVSYDLPEYIMEKDIVRAALRTAKDNDIDDKEWEDFIKRIIKSKDDLPPAGKEPRKK